jgi:hypothetical protein
VDAGLSSGPMTALACNPESWRRGFHKCIIPPRVAFSRLPGSSIWDCSFAGYLEEIMLLRLAVLEANSIQLDGRLDGRPHGTIQPYGYSFYGTIGFDIPRIVRPNASCDSARRGTKRKERKRSSLTVSYVFSGCLEAPQRSPGSPTNLSQKAR